MGKDVNEENLLQFPAESAIHGITIVKGE